jgi:hypothetical protein
MQSREIGSALIEIFVILIKTGKHLSETVSVAYPFMQIRGRRPFYPRPNSEENKDDGQDRNGSETLH